MLPLTLTLLAKTVVIVLLFCPSNKELSSYFIPDRLLNKIIWLDCSTKLYLTFYVYDKELLILLVAILFTLDNMSYVSCLYTFDKLVILFSSDILT